MIELLLKNRETVKLQHTDEIKGHLLRFDVIKFIDYSHQEVEWAQQTFGLDFSIMQRYEDIEISSHLIEQENQISMHISIPYGIQEENLSETPIFFILTSSALFFFSGPNENSLFNKSYSKGFQKLQKSNGVEAILKYQVEFISDYFADITETEVHKIKVLANKVLLEKKFKDDIMDRITKYSFNNLLIKEALIESTRVISLFKKSAWGSKLEVWETIESDLKDLSVVSDYIQFNFERLDDLQDYVANRVDLEQNYIFKMLTVVTVCISLPTLVAGVYGMNFVHMPELKATWGYPLTLISMVLLGIVPFMIAKWKKWL
ncbi:CorA family divalent cation transporter [Persicobacter diffluens]|uniref:Magnesium transport protein CorA n=1 Tax=Persicobacter diffluens TaxID=981 RepID=A0AAN4W1P4_9BACT|nr:magnesium transport protein CorA [Persicobacter diffluens]